MDPWALAVLACAVAATVGLLVYSHLAAHDRGRDGEQRAAAGEAKAHAAELREEQRRAGRAEALAAERLRRLEALVAQGRAWAAAPAADAATLAALDAALAPGPGGALDVDAVADRMLSAARAAGAGDADRGPAPPAAPGPGPAAPG